MTDLPFIDRHRVEIDAPPERAWQALVGGVAGSVGGALGERYARLVGCRETKAQGDPAVAGSTIVGFAVAEAEGPRRLVLEGQHHFSRYRLSFDLEPSGGGTILTATTHAAFPGLHGQLYKTAVIRSRAHVLVTRRMLGAIRRRAERLPA